MLTVVTAEEMRWCDETAIRSYAIPGLLLMENAGLGVVRNIGERFAPLRGKSIVVFCGKGNNGGDGFVIARHLVNEGASVTAIMFDHPTRFKGDAKKNFEILRHVERKSRDHLRIRRFSPSGLSGIRCDLIVDAIFGTGFSGNVKKPHGSAIRWINGQKVPVVSVDIPSGINGTTGTRGNLAVQAEMTVTMGALKTGLICNDGREHAGEIRTVDIGIPRSVYLHTRLKTRLVEALDVERVLPGRRSTVHKYSVGKVFVLAGSRGYTGAAALTASAALRAGAGAVVLGTPESVYRILARKLSETIVSPFPATEEGTLSFQSKEGIIDRMKWADVTVIGPGLSQNPETQRLIQTLLSSVQANILVDADGLNALASFGMKLLRGSKSNLILTPHAGEFSRLSGIPSREVEVRRVEEVRSFGEKYKMTVVLKGAPTATAERSGNVFLNPTGNPGMATVGSGDVLSGVTGSLWAQGMEPWTAAYAGAYLHGLSGDLAREKYGERSIVAQDLIDFLPAAFQTVQGLV